VLTLAQEEARLMNHLFIGTEHILLGLIHEGEGIAARALGDVGVTLAAARREVQETIGIGRDAPIGSPPFTPRAKKVLELSLREALQLGHSYIGTEHILLGLVREGEGVAAQVLVSLGADPGRVRQKVIQLMAGYQGKETAKGARKPFRPRRPGPELDRPPDAFSILSAIADPCVLCGRDLWDVSHFFGAGEVRVCDECVRSAATLLESAPSEPRELALPPRVFGEAPDADSVDELVRLALAVVGPPEDRLQREVAIEDAAALEPALRALADRLTGVSRVSKVRFLPSAAELRFHFRIVGEDGEITSDAVARRVDGRWVLTRTSVLDVLHRGGVELPPTGS
jgi:hypothetical protein